MVHGRSNPSGRSARGVAALALLVSLSLVGARSAQADPFAILAGARGSVRVTSPGGAAAAASFGRGLQRGDKVSVGPGGSATVYFSDGNVIELGEKSSVTIGGRVAPSAAVGPGATLPAGVFASVSRFVTRGSRETGLVAQSTMRGGADSSPFLVAPRKTEVASDRPGFRWRAVAGAARYRLTLSGDSGELWTREAADTLLAFPADAAPLTGDADYLWRVDAIAESGRLRTEESVFHVVSPDLRRTLEHDLSQIEQSAGGEARPATHFLSGSYLFDRGLFQDAAEHFETLARLAPASPAPHEALGNVYRAIGLMDRAAAEYQKALELSRTP